MTTATEVMEFAHSTEVARCPVCGAASTMHRQVTATTQLRACNGCGLIFSVPLALPEGPEDLFSRAYSGKEMRSHMEMFKHRLVWRADLLRDGKTLNKVLPLTQRNAIAYIQRTVQPGSLVLDIGCGSGLFLQANKENDYRVAGVEVAEPAVDFLHQQGYDVFRGTIEDVPDGWVDPAICSAFYVIHHVVDPLGFLGAIRRKFPRADLILTEHYLGNDPDKLAPLNLPPRRLTIWNERSLGTALEKSGYRVKRMAIVPHSPYHPKFDGSLTALYCHARSFIPAPLRPRLIGGYMKVQEKGSAALRRVFGRHDLLGQEHLFAIATPAD
ncbi:MAG TPA: class I SAM-dependent methyltransferase [Dehalococcoidia bacterium]|nr:class I SAM-dependent methyltransferase [Dehalococcoidia bacterium]